MAKTILKEIIIVLLLCLAIILILGVLLYGYIPSTKVIPEAVSYVTPDNIKEELAESNVAGDNSDFSQTYEINASELKNAERINIYNPGKANPFASYEKEETTSTSDSADSNNTNSSTSSSTTDSSIGTSTNTTSNTSAYSIDRGTK